MIIVGVSMSIASIPQIIRLYNRKTSDDISIFMLVLLIHGLVWWLIYGVYKNSTCLIVTNIVALVIDSSLLTLVLYYRKGEK